MSEIVLAWFVFTCVVMGLVAAVLFARRLLAPTGEVALRVNGEARRAMRGERLLEALYREGIHLPAACGGKGTCGQCAVAVVSGGGQVLPTERSRLSDGQIARGLRLACQLVVREALAVQVPEEWLGVRELACRVRSSRSVGTLMKEVVIALPPGDRLRARAGSYVQVRCPPYRKRLDELALDPPVRAEWERLGLLALEAGCSRATTRAYSLANTPREDDCAVLLVRIATPPIGAGPGVPPGVVSSYLFSLAPGDPVTLAGPFGDFFASEGDAEMILVGGGAGMAPLRAIVHDQLERVGTKREISFWYGARSQRELSFVEELDRLAREHGNFHWTVALSEPRPGDAWSGEVGFIHEILLSRYLSDHPSPEECEYYLCGPPLMLSATRAMLGRLGVPPNNVHLDDFGA